MIDKKLWERAVRIREARSPRLDHLSVNDVYLVLEADLEEKLSAKVGPLFEEITYEERLRLIADVCARFGCTRLEELEAADQEAVAAAIGEKIIEEYGLLFEHLI